MVSLNVREPVKIAYSRIDSMVLKLVQEHVTFIIVFRRLRPVDLLGTVIDNSRAALSRRLVLTEGDRGNGYKPY